MPTLPVTRTHSALQLLKHAVGGHRNWPQFWRSPEPKPAYDVVIIGGGGHGLATAYYLVSKHGIRNVALLEKGWLGGGNTGRNTTIVRSNYFYPQSTDLYDHSLRLYEGLSLELNINLMLSQMGILTLANSRHDVEMLQRWSNAIQVQGIACEWLEPEQVQAEVPALDVFGMRYPVKGAFMQRRGGTARHDAVAWGYARGASQLGVDIIQNCEVSGFEISDNRVRAVHTNRGTIRTDKVGIAVAGHSTVLATLAGFKLPLSSMTLQAYVSEPVKPALDRVINSPMVHAYISQSDRGEMVMGAGADAYYSYGQRGNLPTLEDGVRSILEMFPRFSRLKMMRQWGGVVDISPDTSPIIGKTPVTGMYINCGWGTGGFKAIPAGGDLLASTIAHDKPHPLAEPFSLERFHTGRLVDEGAAAGVSH